MKTPTAQGFTLLELMVTLGIVVILALVALPSMNQFVQNERLTTQINGLVASLQRARSEAILRHVPVVVCSSSDGATCNQAAWQNGWILFADDNNNGSPDTNAGETLLQVQGPLAGGNTLRSSSGTTSIVYDSRGFTPNSATTFSLCDSRGSAFGKAITIGNTGRVRSGGTVQC